MFFKTEKPMGPTRYDQMKSSNEKMFRGDIQEIIKVLEASLEDSEETQKEDLSVIHPSTVATLKGLEILLKKYNANGNE